MLQELPRRRDARAGGQEPEIMYNKMSKNVPKMCMYCVYGVLYILYTIYTPFNMYLPYLLFALNLEQRCDSKHIDENLISSMVFVF